MPPKKYPGWDKRLEAALAAVQAPPPAPEWFDYRPVHLARHVPAPFVYGERDAFVWPLQVVDQLCTLSPIASSTIADPIVGQYNDAAGLVAYAASRGWSTAADACVELLGDPLAGSSAVKRAHRGDIVYRPGAPDGLTLLVMVGAAGAVTPRAEGGLEWVRIATLVAEGALAFHLETATLSVGDLRELCRLGLYGAKVCRACGYTTPG